MDLNDFGTHSSNNNTARQSQEGNSYTTRDLYGPDESAHSVEGRASGDI
jgi:hypothetical protein